MKEELLIFLVVCFLLFQIGNGVTNDLFAQDIHRYQVTRVIDGDTIEFIIPDLPKELSKMKLRIEGIDTPENGNRAKCEKEKLLAKEAKDYAKSVINDAADVGITISKWDKYGGRVIGDLIVNGRSFREIMLNKKLAKPYVGGKKESWCTKE